MKTLPPEWSPGDHTPECASRRTFMVGGIGVDPLTSPGAHEVRHNCDCKVREEAIADFRTETSVDDEPKPQPLFFSNMMEAFYKFDTAVAVALPNSDAVAGLMHIAVGRLRQLGWRLISEGNPVDHRRIQGMEFGVTRPQEMHWMLDSWWVEDGGDQWPARPVFWRHIDAEDPDD